MKFFFTLILLLSLSDGCFASVAPKKTSEPDQIFTGRIVAVWCYLREGSYGIDRQNDNMIRNCILRGSPVAIKTDKDVFLVQGADEEVQNKLMILGGHNVRINGHFESLDGHATLSVQDVKRLS